MENENDVDETNSLLTTSMVEDDEDGTTAGFSRGRKSYREEEEDEESEDDGTTLDAVALSRDRSEDAMQTQLVKLFGFDAGRGGLVDFDVSSLHQFLGELGEKIASHDDLLVSPPWVSHLKKQQTVLEDELTALRREVGELRKDVHNSGPRGTQASNVDYLEGAVKVAEQRVVVAPAPSPAPVMASGDFGVTRSELQTALERLRDGCVENLEMDLALESLRESIGRTAEVSVLDGKARLLKLSIEIERLKKTVAVAPSSTEMEALREMYGGKLKALRQFVTEKLATIERGARLEASAGVVKLEEVVRLADTVNKAEQGVLKDLGARCQGETAQLRDTLGASTPPLWARLEEVARLCDEEVEELKTVGKLTAAKLTEIKSKLRPLEILVEQAEEREQDLASQVTKHRERAELELEETRGVQKDQQASLEEAKEALTKLNAAQLLTEARLQKLELAERERATAFGGHSSKIDELTGQNAALESLLTEMRDVDFIEVREALEETKEHTQTSMQLVHTEVAKVRAVQDTNCERLGVFDKRWAGLGHKFTTLDQSMTFLKKGQDFNREVQTKWNEKTSTLFETAGKQSKEDLEVTRSEAAEQSENLVNHESRLKQHNLTQSEQDAHLTTIESNIQTNHGALLEHVAQFKTEALSRFDRGDEFFSSQVDSLRGHVAQLFGSMDDEVAEKIKASPKSPVYFDEADQRVHVFKQAKGLADLSLQFEELCHAQKTVPRELPRETCRAISLIAQEMAAYIALKSDCWAVEQQIHAAPEDQSYEDDTVELKRDSLLANFMSLVVEATERSYPDPGAIRSDARAKALTKSYHALEIALSKMEAVAIVGNSRLLTRRLEVPNCVTCDRPLINSRNLPSAPGCEHVSRPESSLAFPIRQPELGFRCKTASSNTTCSSSGGFTSSFSPVSTAATDRPQRTADIYSKRLRDQELKLNRLTKSDDQRINTAKADSVLRSGFRMPTNGRQGLAPGIAAMMEPNRIQRKRRDATDHTHDEHSILCSKSTSELLPGLTWAR